jgi:hypothetical protein
LGAPERIGEFHDTELLAGAANDDPDFACANPAVYTNLVLQVKSSSRPAKQGVNRDAVISYQSLPTT